MNEIRSVAIVGCGLMGTGIIEASAVAGLRTVGVKVTGGDAEAVKKRIAASLNKAVDKGKLGADQRDRALGLITITSDLEAIAGCDLVIETAAETLPAKHDLLRRIADAVSDDTVIASNTSSLRLSTLAEAVPHPSRFLGLHFFSPANVMKLVEIGSLATTATDVTARVRAFCLTLGKTPVELGDHPGYVVNRLLVPYILHAIETLEHGVAGPEAIDTAMKLGCGHPLGPLALADLIGLDVVFAMSRSLQEELRDSRYRCPPLLRRLVMAGSLGKKTGVGFYRYSGETPGPNPALFDFSRPSLPPVSVPAA
ncbi:MAG: 3-hydroxyacyl-CoA dehydrogenase family protein [Polyangiaceae bacterium]|nr:3-hydroxyacyl-CoA dehydrogenase family protein [Myxococcales bacterium]MCC6903364.1 3-hydroxyacyl-CoA dehydrogenase family protein [Polyangiaceae bacterium]